MTGEAGIYYIVPPRTFGKQRPAAVTWRAACSPRTPPAPRMTLVRGQTMASEGCIEQKPGCGWYQSRTSPVPPLGGAVR
jgi:hypothetical protein